MYVYDNLTIYHLKVIAAKTKNAAFVSEFRFPTIPWNNNSLMKSSNICEQFFDHHSSDNIR